MAKRLKVLMSAYACEPGRSSEPEGGWRWVSQMARFHDVTVVTRANNRGGIEMGLDSFKGSPPTFIYYDLPRWLVAWKQKGFSVSLYYVLWQAAVRWQLRRDLHQFDLIHHVTFNSFLFPGFWWFCKPPVLLGGLGGGQVCPWRFLPLFGRKVFAELFRSFWVLTSCLNPIQHMTYLFASRILVATADTRKRIPRCYSRKTQHFLETGFDLARVPSQLPAADKSGNRLIWISHMEKRKALELTLRAFAQALKENGELRLTIVGAGPDRAPMRELADSLGINHALDWVGRVPLREVLEVIARHNMLLFTSVRDTTGNVILEAMAVGVPVITLRHQGAAELTTDETAIRVPVTTPVQTVAAIGEAILRLAGSAELRSRLGESGRRRVLELYSWDKQGERMDAIYREVVRPHRSSSTTRKDSIPSSSPGPHATSR